MIFQSTLPIQGETNTRKNKPLKLQISIHSPYTGRDGEGEVIGFGVFGFQSTLPIQGETDCNISDNYRNGDFNPLSLYRERR